MVKGLDGENVTLILQGGLSLSMKSIELDDPEGQNIIIY